MIAMQRLCRFVMSFRRSEAVEAQGKLRSAHRCCGARGGGPAHSSRRWGGFLELIEEACS
jgi:hypothetical protein